MITDSWKYAHTYEKWCRRKWKRLSSSTVSSPDCTLPSAINLVISVLRTQSLT